MYTPPPPLFSRNFLSIFIWRVFRGFYLLHMNYWWFHLKSCLRVSSGKDTCLVTNGLPRHARAVRQCYSQASPKSPPNNAPKTHKIILIIKSFETKLAPIKAPILIIRLSPWITAGATIIPTVSTPLATNDEHVYAMHFFKSTTRTPTIKLVTGTMAK